MRNSSMGRRPAESDHAKADHLLEWSSTDIWKAANVLPASLDLGKVIGKFQRILLCWLLTVAFCKVLRNGMKLSKTDRVYKQRWNGSAQSHSLTTNCRTILTASSKQGLWKIGRGSCICRLNG